MRLCLLQQGQRRFYVFCHCEPVRTLAWQSPGGSNHQSGDYMIYFITEEQRRMTHGTCYFEFQKGTFRNEFWKDDSLLLHMNIFDRLDLSSVFTATIPDFDYYGVTHVAPEQYAALKATVQTKMMKLRHFFPSWIFGQPNALKYTTALPS